MDQARAGEKWRFSQGFLVATYKNSKNFRYLKWRNPEPYFRLFLGWVFPYVSRIPTAYVGEDSSSFGT